MGDWLLVGLAFGVVLVGVGMAYNNGDPWSCQCAYKNLRHNGRRWVCRTCGKRV